MRWGDWAIALNRIVAIRFAACGRKRILQVVSLQNIAGQWSFLSEAALENFVWEHLFDLLDLSVAIVFCSN